MNEYVALVRTWDDELLARDADQERKTIDTARTGRRAAENCCKHGDAREWRLIEAAAVERLAVIEAEIEERARI